MRTIKDTGYHRQKLVINCADCPMGFFISTKVIIVCRAAGKTCHENKKDAFPPDWCPLRKGAIIIRLSKKARESKNA